MAESPRYLTGDGEGIREFIDKFDVSIDSIHNFSLCCFAPSQIGSAKVTDNLLQVFLFDCDGLYPEPSVSHSFRPRDASKSSPM